LSRREAARERPQHSAATQGRRGLLSPHRPGRERGAPTSSAPSSTARRARPPARAHGQGGGGGGKQSAGVTTGTGSATARGHSSSSTARGRAAPPHTAPRTRGRALGAPAPRAVRGEGWGHGTRGGGGRRRHRGGWEGPPLSRPQDKQPTWHPEVRAGVGSSAQGPGYVFSMHISGLPIPIWPPGVSFALRPPPPWQIPARVPRARIAPPAHHDNGRCTSLLRQPGSGRAFSRGVGAWRGR
jgi:hypothetical protein